MSFHAFSSPRSQTGKVEAYNAGKLMSMQMTRDKESERQKERNESKEAVVESDICHLVMSYIQASRVTAAVVTA